MLLAEWLRLLVDLITGLSWPLAVLGIAMLFRREIREWIGTRKSGGSDSPSVNLNIGIIQGLPSPSETEVVMGDKYEIGQAGAVGPGAHAHDMTFNQIWNQIQGSTDLSRLADELAALRTTLKQKSSTADHDVAVGAVAEAERAAKEGNGPRAVAALARAGKWSLEVAKDIGTSLAAEVLKKSLGLSP